MHILYFHMAFPYDVWKSTLWTLSETSHLSKDAKFVWGCVRYGKISLPLNKSIVCHHSGCLGKWRRKRNLFLCCWSTRPGSDHYFHKCLSVRPCPIFKISQNKTYKTGVINDPLGQTHSLTSSEHCFRLKFVLLWKVGTYERTYERITWSLLAGLWIWPSGSLMTQVLCCLLLAQTKIKGGKEPDFLFVLFSSARIWGVVL